MFCVATVDMVEAVLTPSIPYDWLLGAISVRNFVSERYKCWLAGGGEAGGRSFPADHVRSVQGTGRQLRAVKLRVVIFLSYF